MRSGLLSTQLLNCNELPGSWKPLYFVTPCRWHPLNSFDIPSQPCAMPGVKDVVALQPCHLPRSLPLRQWPANAESLGLFSQPNPLQYCFPLKTSRALV